MVVKAPKAKSSATGWLRRFGLAALGISAASAIAIGAINIANSNPFDTGANSTIDYAIELNANGTTNQFAMHPDVNFTNGQTNVTWEAWVYPTKTTGLEAIFSKEDSYVIGLNSGELYIYFQNNGWVGATYNFRLAKDTWTHVAVVKTSTRMSTFVNGQLVIDSPGGATSTLSNFANGDYNRFRIGNRTNGEYFSGRIDEARVWSIARTQTQIFENMHSKLSGSEEGLQGYWDFNEPAGATAFDRTSGSYVHNLALQNAPARVDVKQVTSAGGDTVITFPRTYLPGVGTWTVPPSATGVRALVVAGGGGGGAHVGGGGGAGGFIDSDSLNLPAGSSHPIVVGQGGRGGHVFNPRCTNTEMSTTGSCGSSVHTRIATNGQDSRIGAVVQAVGGGRGAHWSYIAPGQGGSGGGGAFSSPNSYLTAADRVNVAPNGGGLGIVGQGNNGGSGEGNGQTGYLNGGGGGAGGPGENFVDNVRSGNGGLGRSSDIYGTGSAVRWFASGGGGGNHDPGFTPGAASAGGGGSGSQGSSLSASQWGAANTGGGGGGGGNGSGATSFGGPGGSGVVVVRYTPAIDGALQITASDQVTGNNVIPTATNSNFTLEAWVYPTNLTGWKSILNQTPGLRDGGARTFLGAQDGVVKFWVNAGVIQDTGTTIALNQWSHVALTVSGTSVKFYLNGVETYSNSSYSRPTVTGSVFHLGGTHVTSEHWVGFIDQVKVWNSALGSTNLTTSMHAYGSGNIAGLVAHYDFNDYLEGVEPDRSGNGANLALATGVTADRYSSERIVETGTAHDLQTFVKFNRSYLTAVGGWTPPTNVTNFKALVVGGGGAGGFAREYSAGGGGGGQAVEIAHSGLLGVQRVTVGIGGVARVQPSGSFSSSGLGPTSGQESNFGGAITALGGGFGASGNGAIDPYFMNAGGAPAFTGGGGGAQTSGKIALPGSGSGFSGGAARGDDNSGDRQSGGGGAGATGNGFNGTESSGGAGGPGLASQITGSTLEYGVGGQGGRRSNDSPGISGSSNTGAGGSGSGRSSAGVLSAGGHGGSGVVILSYGPTLELVAPSPTSVRAGSQFATPIVLQLTDIDGTPLAGAGEVVTVRAATNTILTLNGANVDSATATSAADGTVTFSGLGFRGGVTGTQTLTFTSDPFVGTTLEVETTFVASTVNITASGTTSGSFVNGVFESNTTGAANILNTDLQTAMTSGNVLVETTGDITVQASVVSATADSDLTLKARGNINLNANQRIQTNGGDVVLWSDSDATNGGVIRLLNNSEICTVSGTAGPSGACSTTTTGGGDVILGGGAADPDNPGRPAGFASGYGTAAADNAGVQIGTLLTTNAGSRIYSAGGSISIRGNSTSVTSATYVHGVVTLASSVISAGSGKILIEGSGRFDDSDVRPIAFTVSASTGTDTKILSTNTSTDAVVLSSYATGSTNQVGLGFGGKVTVDVEGGFTVEADRVVSPMEFDFGVKGPITFKPVGQGTTMVTAASGFTFHLGGGGSFARQNPSAITIGSASNTSPIVLSQALQTTAGDISLLSSGNVTMSAATTAAGNLNITGATVAVNANQTTTGTGNIAINPSAGYTGSGVLNSAGTLTISGGTTVAPTAAIQATGNITISGSGLITNATAPVTSSAGSISITSTAGAATVSAALSAAKAIDVVAEGASSLLSVNANVTTSASAASDRLTLKSRAGITVEANRTLQTAGSDLVLWAGSADGDGGLVVGAGTCLNTNASCNRNDAISSGDIILGGGSIGTTHPTGPARSASNAAVLIGNSTPNGATVLSGGGNISIYGASSTWQGVLIYNGSIFDSKTGSIDITGTTTTTTTGRTALIFQGLNATTEITSAKTSGTAISLKGVRGPGAVAGRALALVEGTIGLSATGGGNIDVFAEGGRLDTSSLVSITADDGNVGFVTDEIIFSGTANAVNGVVTLSPHSTNRDIKVQATKDATTLTVTASEISRISARTLRLSTSGTGSVLIGQSLNLTGKVTNLAIRAGGNVTGAAGVVITVANLGIDAGGTISFPGNQAASVIALAGTAVSYTQTSDYSVAAVDGIDPEFGYGVRFAISDVPVSGTLDAFMAVVFNPPPTVTIRDKFDNTLATNNLSAADYAVATSFTLTSTTSGTPTLDGATPTRSGGTFTFSSLRIIDGTGTGTFTYSATRSGTSLAENSQFQDGSSFTTQATPTFTTSTYNIQAGEPASIDLAFASLTAAAGKTGLAPTATLKDSGGNTITSGPHASATITLSIAGTDGLIVSGATAPTAAGVASFPDLVLGGKVGTTYTLTFSVTFTNTQNPPQSVTVSEPQDVTLTFGDATKVTLGAATQTAANRSTLADIVATVRDAYDNVVTNYSTNVTLDFADGAVTELVPVVSGYSAQTPSNGLATFSGISFAAKTDTYTITARSGTLAVDTQDLTITHGAAAKLTVTAPANATNDVTFTTQPVVRIFDADDNPVTTGAQSQQAVTLSATGATLSGVDAQALSMPAVAGAADFAGKGLKLTGTAGQITLTATIASPGPITKDATITLGFGAATKLDISQAAVGFVNRTNFSTQPEVTVQDVSGNTVEDFNGTITFEIGSGATITGTPTITLAAPNDGVARFTGLGLQGTIGSYTITARSGALTVDTQTVSISHGAAHSLELTIPVSVVNDAVFAVQPQVRILDEDGNEVSTGTQSEATVVLTSADAIIAGTLTDDAAAGIAEFSGVKLTSLVGSRSITATAASLSLSVTQNTTVTFGAANKLAVTREPGGFVNRVEFAIQPQITVQDISGNTVTNFAGTVAVTATGPGNLVGDVDIDLTASDLGVANFGDLELQGTIGQYTLTFESTAGIAPIARTITLGHGAATQLRLVQQGAGARAGQAFDTPAQVAIEDFDGNRVTTGDDAGAQIQVSKTQGAFVLDDRSSGADFGGLQTVTAQQGLATFTDLTLSGVAKTYDLSFAATAPAGLTGFTSVTQTIELRAGARNSLSMVTQPQAAIAGVDFEDDVQVEIIDAWQNRVLAESGTEIVVSAHTVAAGSLRGTLTQTAASGLVTFTDLDVTKIGTFKLHFTTDGLSVLQSDDFLITHAAASQIVFDGAAPTTARNDIIFSPAPALRVFDEFENPVTSGPELTVTATVVSANTGDVMAISGDVESVTAGSEAVSFDELKLKAPAANYKLRFTVTVAGSASTFFVETGDVALTFGEAFGIAIETQAAGARAGIAFDTPPVIEVRDSADNVVGDSTLRITASIGGGRTLIGPNALDAQGGIATFTGLGIQGEVANGLLLTFTAANSGTPFTASQSIDLVAGNATRLRITEQPGIEVVTRVAFSPDVAVELLDNDDNPVGTDSLTSVGVDLIDANGLVPIGTASTAQVERVSAQAASGIATFEDLSYAVAPGANYKLRFVLGAFTIDSSAFTVLPGAVASIVIDQQPSTTNLDNSLVKTGELLAQMPEVSLYDVDGYLANNATGSVTVSIASGAGGDLSEGNTTATISGGGANFTGIKLVGTPAQRGAAAEQYTLRFSHSGVDSDPSSALTVTHNVADQLFISRDAAGGQAGEVFTTTPLVEIRDRYNNLVENAFDQVRAGVSAGGSITTGSTVSAQGGIADFRTLGLGGLTTNTYAITFEIASKPLVTTATQTGITLTHGFARKLFIDTAPESLDEGVLTKTGDALAQQPVIHVLDAHDNLVLDSSDLITVSYVTTRDDRDRIENATASAENGVATFADLTLIARPGLDYRLNFTSGQLTNTQSENLQVRHGDAAAIEIVTQPSAVIDSANGILTRTGNSLHIQPSIRVLDFDGNHADSISGLNVSATLVPAVVGSEATNYAVTDNDGSPTPRPFNEAVISGGSATFSELKLVATPGVAQSLVFTGVFPTGPSTSVTVTSDPSSPLTVTNALAHSLALDTEPCAGLVVTDVCQVGVTGEILEVQPVVKVLDFFGNLVVDHVGDVVASVSAAGARLSVTDATITDGDDVTLRTKAVSGGYASFSGLELTATPGAAVKINFASDELTGVSSRDLVVAAAAPDAIVMTREPVGARTGDLLSTQPQVKIVDRFGNTVLSDSSTVVTVTASGGTLFSDPVNPSDPVDYDAVLTATADEGIVDFAGLKFIGAPSEPFTLSFASNGLTGTASAQFTVTNAFADRLLITQQPVAGKTADLLGQMPRLKLEDFDENLAADDNTTVVTVSIDTSNGGAWFVDENDNRLVNNPTATAVAGVIEFTGLRIEAAPGTVYKLNFSAQSAADPDTQVVPTAFSSAPSAELIFTHANPAQIVMTQSAIGGTAGQPLTTQPELQVLDRFGNPATSDNATVVTASLASGLNGSLVSGTTFTAENGLVRFPALAVDGLPSETYTLSFAATSAFGANFAVTDTTEFTLSRQTALTLSFSPAALPFDRDAVVTPIFTSDSLGAITWTTSTNPSICELELDGSNNPTGSVVIKGVGDCSLRASAARDEYVYATAPTAAYTPAEVSANLEITKARQDPLLISSPNNINFRATMPVTTSGGSGEGRVTFFIAEDSTCRIIGGVLIPGEAGSYCEIFARKAGDANYLRADSDDMLITVNRIQQEPLRIVNTNAVSVGDIELVVAGGSGNGDVVYQVSTPGPDGNNAQCSIIDGATPQQKLLRATQNGECSVMATKAASTNHLVAISPEVTFTFSKATQVVNFTSVVPARPSPGMFYDPVAVASSGLPVVVTISAGEGTACRFDDEIATRIRFMTSGTCELTATQGGSSQFNSAATVQVIVVNALNQTITFGAIEDMKFGDPKFQLTATASSGLPVSYRVGTTFADPGCSVTTTGRVTLERAGRCEIIASQPGNTSYLPAPEVTQLFTVSPDKAGAPHLMSVSVSNSAIVAKFRAPSYLGGSAISAYRMEATNGEGDRYVNPGCQPSATDVVCELVGMPLGVAYTVRIAAVTAAGIGIFSEPSLPVTPGATEIAVSMLSAQQTAGQLEVTWTPPASFDSEFAAYEIYVWPLNSDRPEEPNFVMTGDSQASSANFTLIEPTPTTDVDTQLLQSFSLQNQSAEVTRASSYNIRVVTLTDESDEAFDDINVASGMQLGLGVPARPRNEQLTVMADSLLAAWSPPVFDGGDAVTHYIVRINDVETRIENELGLLSIEQGELRAGQTYEISIYAHNSVGASEPAILTHSIPAPPAASSPVLPVVPDEEEELEPAPAPESVNPAPAAPEAGATRPRPLPGPSQSPSDLLDDDVTEGEETPGGLQPSQPTRPAEPDGGETEPITDGDGSTAEADGASAGELQAGNLQLLLLILLLIALLLLARRLKQRKASAQGHP